MIFYYIKKHFPNPSPLNQFYKFCYSNEKIQNILKVKSWTSSYHYTFIVKGHKLYDDVRNLTKKIYLLE